MAEIPEITVKVRNQYNMDIFGQILAAYIISQDLDTIILTIEEINNVGGYTAFVDEGKIVFMATGEK